MKKKVVPLNLGGHAVSSVKDLESVVENAAEILGLVREELENGKRVEYRRSIAYDENGEVIYDVKKKPAWQNGGGFVISYTEKMCDFIAETGVGSTVRVFLFIAHHQNYGVDGVYGYRCSHKYLQQVLRLDRKSVYNALKFLKEKFLIHEGRFDGSVEFMVNPSYVTIGTDKKKRVTEWNKRWAAYWKKKHNAVLAACREERDKEINEALELTNARKANQEAEENG